MESHTQVVRLGNGGGRIATPVSSANPLPIECIKRSYEGVALPLDSLPQSLAYDGAGRLSSVSVTHNGVTYAQAITYDAEGRLSSVSAWEAQP